MKRRTNFGMSIGTSSILLIFIVLCLVSFAALTLSSAVADQKLTQRSQEKTTAYYEACSVAEQKLASLDQDFAALYATGISQEEYYERLGETQSFTVAISDSQSLYIEIAICYPETDDDSYYEITSWQEITSSDLEYDDSLNVYGSDQ